MVVGDFSENADTIVIGSGPGGYVAAIRAAQLGKDVKLIEKAEIGGVCLNVGCIPSKAIINVAKEYSKTTKTTPYGLNYNEAELDMNKLQEWKDNEVVGTLTKGVEFLLKKHKVEVIKGQAYFVSENSLHVSKGEDQEGITYQFNDVIVATGSSPIEIAGFEFGEDVLDSTGLLELNEVPESLTIIGGGYIGMELAGAFADLGSEVTIIEGMDRVLSGFEKDVVKPVTKAFKDKGVTLITDAKALRYEKNTESLNVIYEVDGKEETLETSKLAVLVGRRPNTEDVSLELAGVEVEESGLVKVNEKMQTNNPHIYAIGDIVEGPALAHKASYEAKIAAAVIAGQKGVENDYLVIPTVCFTEPEIASVGMTKAEAKEAGIEVETAKFNFQSNGRALSMNQKNGFVRLVAERETLRIIGAQIVGPEASELITEATLVIENLMTAEDVALTIHGHPSLSECIIEASEALMNQAIHQ